MAGTTSYPESMTIDKTPAGDDRDQTFSIKQGCPRLSFRPGRISIHDPVLFPLTGLHHLSL